MQYESIILELMSRIKALEGDVANLKAAIHSLEMKLNSDENTDVSAVSAPAAARNTIPYTKMTGEMMDICYSYGKKAYLTPDANIGDFADAAAREARMNRSSALMYIYAVKNMLEGKVFKRTISAKALEKYFSAIYAEFGKAGLSNAIAAARAHIEYRQSCSLPADSIAALCDEFQGKI